MTDQFSYDNPELELLLETRTLLLWDHQYLDSVLSDYVRCEPHERTSYEQRHFRTVWEHRSHKWQWDSKQPSPKENPEYHQVQRAVSKYFHDKGRVRVGTFELPPEVAKKIWSGEQVAGWLYSKEIKELVRKVTGLVPGRRDGFLAQFMKARRQFQRHFAKACSAFSNMCLRDYGVWPIIFYSGLPGMGIPANIHEALQVKSIARRGLRDFANVEEILDIVHDYVFDCAAVLNNTPNLVNAGRKKTKKDYIGGDLYSIDEHEDIVASDDCSRLIIRPERIVGELKNTKALQHVLWQMVTCAHNCNTSNPDLQPPWLALSTRAGMEELLSPACLPPDESIGFGYNLSNTSMKNAKGLIDHFIDVGFLEFKKVWSGGKVRDPLDQDERWHMLRPDAGDESDAETTGDSHTNDKSITTSKPPQFGSAGPVLPITIEDPANLAIPVRDIDFQPLDDPPDISYAELPHRDPADPAWCPPCAVPSTAWARGQYVYKTAREIGGAEMQAISRTCMALVQCPLEDNYAIPLKAIIASKPTYSPPPMVRWSSDRAWIRDIREAESIGQFIQRKPWTFSVQGSTIFSGYSQTWAVLLAALTYARGRAHKDVLSNTPCPNWALSGQDVSHERARGLQFDIPSVTLMAILTDLRLYLENIAETCQYPGVPPSLLYSRFDSRSEYLRCLLNSVPELIVLLKAVLHMVRQLTNLAPRSLTIAHLQPEHPPDDTPLSCLPDLAPFIDKCEDIGTLWNWPRCGMPSATHLRDDHDELLEAVTTWWTDGDLFCSLEEGNVRPRESALFQLLQVGLLCQDLDNADNQRTSSCGTHVNTIFLDDNLRNDMRDVIAAGALAHNESLQSILRDYDQTAFEGPSIQSEDLQRYDAEGVVFASSVSEHNARLLAESAPTDGYTLSLQNSLLLEARNEDLPRTNAAIRTQQNKDNRQRTGHKHPPKPIAAPPTAPDLSFINDVTLPDVSGHAAPPAKRRKKKPQQRLTIRSKVPPPPNTSHSTVSKPSTKNGRKRAGAAPIAEPGRKRRRTNKEPLFEPGTSDEEQESFDLDNVSGDDSDTSPKQQDATVSKPRPRPVKSGATTRTAPGISTSFHDAVMEDQPLSPDVPIVPSPARVRRSAIKSSSVPEQSGSQGPQTRARSRSLRFAEAPPSSHTRSKTR